MQQNIVREKSDESIALELDNQIEELVNKNETELKRTITRNNNIKSNPLIPIGNKDKKASAGNGGGKGSWLLEKLG